MICFLCLFDEGILPHASHRNQLRHHDFGGDQQKQIMRGDGKPVSAAAVHHAAATVSLSRGWGRANQQTEFYLSQQKASNISALAVWCPSKPPFHIVQDLNIQWSRSCATIILTEGARCQSHPHLPGKREGGQAGASSDSFGLVVLARFPVHTL